MVRRDAPVLPAAAVATAATVVLVLLIYVGSRRLKDFDAALVGYAVGNAGTALAGLLAPRGGGRRLAVGLLGVPTGPGPDGRPVLAPGA